MTKIIMIDIDCVEGAWEHTARFGHPQGIFRRFTNICGYTLL